MSYLGLFVDLSQYAAIRSVRVFRALKSVNVVPGLKKIVGAVVYSVKNLNNVIVLTIFILAIFALLGLQVYMGVLTKICIADYNPHDIQDVVENDSPDKSDVLVMNQIALNGLYEWRHSRNGTGFNGSVTWDDWIKNKDTWFVSSTYSSHSAGYIICSNSSGGGACPVGTTCIEVLFALVFTVICII